MTTRNELGLAAELARRLDGCPEADDLARCHDGSAPEILQRRVEEHAQDCTGCASALHFLASTAMVESTTEAPGLPTDVAQRVEERIADVRAAESRQSSAIGWSGLLRIAAGLFFIGALWLAGTSWLDTGRLTDDLGAPRGAPTFDTIAPAGVVTEAPSEMSWTPHASAAAYRVILLDESLEQVWSQRTAGPEPRLALDAAARALLLPGRTFVWQVVALSPIGESIERSAATRFKVSDETHAR